MARRTQVGIIGCGPAGLFLAHLLARAGIDSLILEARSRDAVEGTIRAGVLEHGVAALMQELGLAARMLRQASRHAGITLQWRGQRLHLDLAALTGGKAVTVYAQHEVLKDLVAARLAAAPGSILFDTPARAVEGIEGAQPSIVFETPGGSVDRLDCDYVVAADGFHGIGRGAIPASIRQEYGKKYPFGWLGVLVEAPRSWPELIYASQGEGFSLLSTRSATVQRMYLQCDPADPVEAWDDARIWRELDSRLGVDNWELARGKIFQKSVIPLRSFVCAPLRHGRLFLAGDAAHIVPPTGAKGLNLAVADVLVLSRALARAVHRGEAQGLEAYSDTALARVWQAQRFSAFMTRMLHRDPGETPFDTRLREAQLEQIATSRAAATALAENYVGLPFPDEE
ncbi:4-hydroxybenzoate 3-monooxygenase [Roseomonas sp. 18066]|uniref:4-hydroxybenzoate 3-monooxygenase n=1 Tax=Roseomonas sp. 18066 TaxID=2681412 RepID=UPI00135C381C|nr:4-hydroxybenzoate 3-monooxygenase [Roseomonas sp. 18066]